MTWGHSVICKFVAHTVPGGWSPSKLSADLNICFSFYTRAVTLSSGTFSQSKLQVVVTASPPNDQSERNHKTTPAFGSRDSLLEGNRHEVDRPVD